MNVRRSAAVLAATVVVAGAAPAVAASPSPSPSVAIPDGLFGTADPTYDGVWRQSLALLAQHTAAVEPAPKAVAWLSGQQCADGSFAAFRADPARACAASTPVDTNSTAAAAQALAALGGHRDAVGKAVGWLKSAQNKDGGWGYTAGDATDANSTAVVVGALVAAGERPADVRTGGHSPDDALLKLALPCADGGAFAYQPDAKGALTANDDATAAAVVGALGKGLAGDAAKPAGTAPACADATDAGQAARNGAAHLAGALAKDGHLVSALPGAEDQPDYGNTADAVVALATAGHADRAAPALRWLRSHAGDWAARGGPAAWAQLVLAAHAGGADPRAFGGRDLVERLGATGPAPERQEKKEKRAADDDGSWPGVGWLVGVGLLVGAGAGFLLSGRRKAGRS
ncbi:prenyltransferase/squalene oxidase repeat-containing protein [Streptomyces sp. ACT015]|uniref:prenyltransferase/squalene oxidase repeat-containing protein n=1 Tax=Streptomyces sp. ACT015 TaxID=3134807 RepID=UPI003D16E183